MFKNNFKKGFTIIELTIVVFILAVGIVGIMGLVSRIFNYTNLISSKLIAAYLSQEGIEIVRNIRDSNWIEEDTWDSGLTTGTFEADHDDFWLSPWGAGRYLYFGNNLYSYDSGIQTNFKRQIRLDKDISGDSIEVCSSVMWQQNARNYEVEACEEIYNWKIQLP